MVLAIVGTMKAGNQPPLMPLLVRRFCLIAIANDCAANAYSPYARAKRTGTDFSHVAPIDHLIQQLQQRLRIAILSI